MIKLRIRENGIILDGHANRHDDHGNDLACAAISALTVNLVNSLKTFGGAGVLLCDVKEGGTAVEWQGLTDKGKLLVDSWFLGIADINNEYNCITYI